MFDLRWSKGLIVTLLLLFAGQAAVAQKNNPNYDEKPIHFGFLVGLNYSSLQMRLDAPSVYRNDTLRYIYPNQGPGFHLGVISDLRMTEHMTLRFTPTLMFSQRNLQYSFENPINDIRKAIQVANVDLPINIKWRSDRINNYRIYLISGFKYSIDMASQQRVVEDVERVKLMRHDFAYELGIGVDLYLPFFKLSPELKFSQGIRNLMVPETHKFAASLLGLQSRSVIISFNFE